MEFRPVEEIIDDTEKGASELAVDAARALQHLDEKEAEDYVTRLIKNRGSMTPLVNLANEFFLALEKGEDHQDVSKRFMERIQTAKEKLIENAERIMKKQGLAHVATLSYSSTAVETLANSEEVTVFESRPKKEGRKTAENLAPDTKVNYWVDAAVMKGLKGVDAVMVGADTITKDLFINKIGTSLLVLGAKRYRIPVYVLADTTKYLPEGLQALEEELHPSEEVWQTDEENIQVQNDYFEAVPLDLYSELNFITEDGPLKREGVKREVDGKELSQALRAYHS
ncbi:MAG: hypothetical protein V5A88_03970 [Candidatus Thermoplasmatota archaeon]